MNVSLFFRCLFTTSFKAAAMADCRTELFGTKRGITYKIEIYIIRCVDIKAITFLLFDAKFMCMCIAYTTLYNFIPANSSNFWDNSNALSPSAFLVLFFTWLFGSISVCSRKISNPYFNSIKVFFSNIILLCVHTQAQTHCVQQHLINNTIYT